MVSGISGGGQTGLDASALWQDLLKRADQDGDGKISKEEMEASMPQKGRGPSVDEIFSKIDTNGDGYIEESENATWVQNMPKEKPPDPAEMFQKADKDGDGKITKAEFKAAAPKGVSESTVDKVFDSMDTNQDGVVSAEEYAAAMQKKNLTAQLSSQEGFSALV
jgi:Ca2+-binding EF-hand superfamily protein